MNKYDLTILVKEPKGVEEKMEKLAKALEAKLGRMIEMGKKQLAYPINKISEAVFLSWTIELTPKAVVELGRKLSVDRDIIRHLLVKVEK